MLGGDAWLLTDVAMKKPAEIIELDVAQFEELKRHLEQRAFEEGDYAKLRGVLDAYLYLVELVENKKTTLARLRKLLFGASTEKTADVVGREAPTQDNSPSPSDPAAPQSGDQKRREKKAGHGRNGADRYAGASRVKIRHASLQPGDSCPECGTGTAYLMAKPGVLVRFLGQPPLTATIYELEKLRCNLCGKIFTAQVPAQAGAEKYDANAVSIIAMLRYGLGFPFHRLDRLQKDLEIPLPASTQWEIVSAAYDGLTPVHEEFIRQAAQGELLHHDDTNVKILELMGERAKQQAFDESQEENDADRLDPERKGLFTSGVVALSGEQRIALFLSGRRHAGENLIEILRQRASGLPPPIQMCDALSRNMPSELQTIVANCLAHGRRQFVEVNERFPAECRYVLEVLEQVYRNDATARKDNLSPEQRLLFHQTHSGPVMQELRAWLKRQFDERRVEPNSGLGAAVNYLRKHWEKLTLFLRVAGAPLDNNLCERALKKAIMHRKNSLFYKTQNGADVGDLYMSLIHTCELNGVNPFDYLTELQRHADMVASDPAAWLPWNYREQLVPAAA